MVTKTCDTVLNYQKQANYFIKIKFNSNLILVLTSISVEYFF